MAGGPEVAMLGLAPHVKEAGLCPVGDGASGWVGESFSVFHLRDYWVAV